MPPFVAEEIGRLPPHAWNARPVDRFGGCSLVQCDLVRVGWANSNHLERPCFTFACVCMGMSHIQCHLVHLALVF